MQATEATGDTAARMGRSKTELRELVGQVLERDPEISINELVELFPDEHRHTLANALHRERKERGITTWRLERTAEEVAFVVRLPGDVYDEIKSGDRVVSEVLREIACALSKKK